MARTARLLFAATALCATAAAASANDRRDVFSGTCAEAISTCTNQWGNGKCSLTRGTLYDQILRSPLFGDGGGGDEKVQLCILIGPRYTDAAHQKNGTIGAIVVNRSGGIVNFDRTRKHGGGGN